ncbi:DNA mismatch repair protein Mlh3, partial [Durusdinium trenchii]
MLSMHLALCVAFLVLPGTDGGWPFEGILGEVPKVQPLPHGLPHGLPHAFPGAFPFGRAPVIVVEHHSGFNPWEDLHKNVQRVVQAQAGGPTAVQPVQMQMQLGGLLDMFGDHHAGHHGLAQGSFEVHDDHQSRVLISAVLPGYEFGTKTSEKPLSVRAVGRSLVISGTHHQGPLISQWQRVFSVPKGCDVKNVSVTYNSGSGNLTVVIPRSNTTVPQEDEEADEDDMIGLPPALRALRSGLPGLMDQMAGMQA